MANFTVSVYDQNNSPLEGCFIALRNTTGSHLDQSETNENGKTILRTSLGFLADDIYCERPNNNYNPKSQTKKVDSGENVIFKFEKQKDDGNGGDGNGDDGNGGDGNGDDGNGDDGNGDDGNGDDEFDFMIWFYDHKYLIIGLIIAIVLFLGLAIKM